MKIDKSVVETISQQVAINTEICRIVGEKAIQAYLLSITKKFDPEDESTWPSFHEMFLVMYNFGGPPAIIEWRSQATEWKNVVAYIDPADIFQGEE